MQVINVHERELHSSPELVGALIDSLSSSADALWPWHSWPRMTFNRPLAPGAQGGHGPVRYRLEEYVPGRALKFRFTGPKGFDGFHLFEVAQGENGAVILRHSIRMRAHGAALLSWPLVFRPMHDALIEDCMAQAQASLGQPPLVRRWSSWVKFLRWVISRGKTRAQRRPEVKGN